MAINVIDTLEPGGEGFRVAHAKHIEYSDANLEFVMENNLYDKIAELDSLINAIPEFSYVSDNTTLRLDLNSILNLNFNLSSRVAGSCRVVIYKSSWGDTDNLQQVKEFTVSQGRQSLTIGKLTTTGDFCYRIMAFDSLNREALLHLPNGDTQNYLEFRVIAGGISFSSSYASSIQNVIFSTNLTSLNYIFNMNYPLSGYRWLFYKIIKSGEEPGDFLDWQRLLLNDGEIVEGGIQTSYDTFNPLNLPISFDENYNGTYQLVTCCGVVENINNSSDFNNMMVSKELKANLDVITGDSATIVTIVNYSLGRTSTDITFIPKTTIAGLQTVTDALRATCVIYKEFYTLNNNEETFSRQEEYARYTDINCTHNKELRYSLSNLPYVNGQGEKVYYKIEITCTGQGVETDQIYPGIINKIEVENYSNSYETEGLEFYFLADNSSLNNNKWKNKTNKNYEIELNNLDLNNISSTITVKDNSYNVFNFLGEGYGILKYNNTNFDLWDEFLTASDGNGFTLETFISSDYIGNPDAIALSTGQDVYQGIQINYEQVKVKHNDGVLTPPILTNNLQHITIVADPIIRKDDPYDLNPYCTLRVYIDGILTKINKIASIDQLANNLTNIYQYLVINGVGYGSSLDEANISNYGQCSIRMLRGYTIGLTPDQIYTNYLNVLDTPAYEEITTRNSQTLNTFYFTRNQDPSDEAISYWNAKSLNNITFSVLNDISDKYNTYKKDANGDYELDSDGNKIIDAYGSKSALVNCTMHFYENGVWDSWDDVDVYLQGTSSLKYPVKNYQIKIYTTDNGERKELKTLPPFIDLDDKEWQTPSAVYTLKCDYMEQGHRNNTPTACYYQDRVIYNVINEELEIDKALEPENLADSTLLETYNQKYSPARRVIKYKGETPYRPYRDAINGFACSVYYNDNPIVNDNDDNVIEGGYNINSEYNILAGSYMFNVDKTGEQLGFKLPVENQITSIHVPKLVPKLDEEGNQILDSKGKEVKEWAWVEQIVNSNYIPCISYEGASNHDMAAGSFVPHKYYQDKYNEYVFNKKLPIFLGKEQQTFNTFDELKQAIEDLKESEIKLEAEDPDFDGRIPLISQEEFESSTDKYKYMAATLEPRYTFTDKLNLDEESDEYKELTYSPLERALDWVYENKDNYTNFTQDFNKYFSFEYCLAYFLQMITFTQTDNAGKNAMFDVWFDPNEWQEGVDSDDPGHPTGSYGILFPRPYDMDTQMGLDNQGNDSRLPSSELNISLSPMYYDGTEIKSNINQYIPNWDTVSSPEQARYNMYNASNSILWIAFGKHFSNEIKAMYSQLRSRKIYDLDEIWEYVNQKTSERIGEKVYNADANLKFISYTDEKGEYSPIWLYTVQGNRKNRYKQFLEQRLIFLDSYYNHTGTNTTFKLFQIRSNASNTIGLGFQPYSPQYIRISVDETQANITTFLDPDNLYEEVQQTHIKIPVTGKNKNINFYGLDNIKQIEGFEKLKVDQADFSTVSKLIKLNLSGSAISSADFSNNKYLKQINLSNIDTLSESAINLRNSSYIEEIIAENTNTSGISLAENCLNLRTLNLSENRGISVLEIDGAINLSNLNLTNCTKMQKLHLINCKSLGRDIVFSSDSTKQYLITQINPSTGSQEKIAQKFFDLRQMPNLNNIKITGCDNIKTLDFSHLSSINNLELTGPIENLDLSNSGGVAYNNLSLIGLNNLKYLDINNTASTHEGTKAIYLTDIGLNLKYLDTTGTGINILSTNTKETQLGVYDFNTINFDNEAKLYFSVYRAPNYIPNLSVSEIKNLNYTGNLQYFFRGCSKLQYLTDCVLSSTGENGDGIFWGCSQFINIRQNINEDDELTNWDLSSITKGTYMFYSASNVKFNLLKTLLNKLSNVTNINYYAYYASSSISGTKIIDTGYFVNNPSLETLNMAFCGVGITEIKSNIFYTPSKEGDSPNNITELRGCFSSNKNLTKVSSTILQRCTHLKIVSALFYGCEKLATFLNSTDKPFNSGYIEDISFMFALCPALSITSSDVLNNFITSIGSSLKQANCTFLDCTSIKDCTIPDNFLNGKSNLTTINGMFSNTRITKLPKNFFGTSNLKNLTSAIGLFANCIKMQGIIPRTFFKYATSLINIGSGLSTKISLGSEQSFSLMGMFANTNITGFDKDFLTPLTQLKNASKLFFNSVQTRSDDKTTIESFSNGSGGTGALYCLPGIDVLNEFYIYDTSKVETNAYSEDIYDEPSNLERSTDLPNIFNNNNQLTTTEGMFAGNNKITKISSNLFTNNSVLQNTSNMFLRCSSLVCDSLSGLLKNKSNLTQTKHMFAHCNSLNVNIPTDMFEGCVNLKETKGMFFKSGITGDIPAELFNDCRNTIEDISYMFAYCLGLTQIKTGKIIINDDEDNTINIIQKGLLSDCKNLRKVNHMFCGCEYLTGPIPADMFYTPTGTYDHLTSLAHLFAYCYRLTMHNPSDNTQLSNYNNTHLYKQDDTPIYWSGGGNFKEIIPNLPDLNNYLTIINNKEPLEENDYQPNYFIPYDWFNSLTAVTTIEKLFFNVGTLRGYIRGTNENYSKTINNAEQAFSLEPFSPEDTTSQGTQYFFLYSILKLDSSTFSPLFNLQNITNAFGNTNGLILLQLNSGLFSDNKALTTADYAFFGAQVSSISTIFADNLKTLTSANYALAFANSGSYKSNCYLNSEISRYSGLADKFATNTYVASAPTLSNLWGTGSKLTANKSIGFVAGITGVNYDEGVTDTQKALLARNNNYDVRISNFTNPTGDISNWNKVFTAEIR